MAKDFSMMGHDHVACYLETNGEVGQFWNGVTCLVLFTRGRRSGEIRAVPLIYGEDDDRLVVVASRGGSPQHPFWYANVQSDPAVSVQVGAERVEAFARTAVGDERVRLWALMNEIWPYYDRYQSRTEREIPVVVLELAALTARQG
jgi:deazaflavin-dependent oxidoreductase (nitroreductase family)